MSAGSDARSVAAVQPSGEAAQIAGCPVAVNESRVLLIKAKGGLGNRMLSAVTGVILAQLGGRLPVVDWRDGMYVPEGVNLYPRLFRDPTGVDAARFDRCDAVAPAIWSGRLSEQPINIIVRHFPDQHSSPFLYRRLSIPLTGRDPDAPVGVFWSYLPKLARLRRRMRGDRQFAGRGLNAIVRDVLQRFFTPNARVCRAVEELFASRRRPVIGVHIRFTDRKVPLPRIERALARLRATLPDSDIFLATDSAAAQDHITARFDRVFTIDKQLGTDGGALHYAGGAMADPLREAENAVIDMYALAACDWLIHSRHSTFSVAASLIGGIPARRQIDVDRFNAKVVAKRWFQALA
jgi:hypothetical protein